MRHKKKKKQKNRNKISNSLRKTIKRKKLKWIEEQTNKKKETLFVKIFTTFIIVDGKNRQKKIKNSNYTLIITEIGRASCRERV